MAKLLIFLGFFSISAASLGVESQIKKNNPTLDPRYVKRLAKAIRVSARKHGLQERNLAAILMQESRYEMGVISGKDYGIAQINEYNIKAYGLSKKKILVDLEYSVDAGARVLSYFKRKYAKKEPKTWSCRYNVGTGPLKVQDCHKYLKLKERWL